MKQDIEKILNQYKVLHTPTTLSVYHYWATQTFSNDDLLMCGDDEKENYYKRLEDGRITICDSIKAKQGHIGTLHDLVNIINNPNFKSIKKLDRKVIYSSDDGNRPIGRGAFDVWSGFQVIDMDIKNREFASYVKEHVFQRLKKYNWFLGVAFSSSGTGLHLYTKIRVSENDKGDSHKMKMLYLANFRHKYSFVYLACLKVIEGMVNEDGSEVTKNQLMKWLDLAMYKPQQGAFIGYDEHPLINTNFFEDFIYVNFDNVEDMGHPDVDWITHPDLKEMFKRHEWFEESDEDQPNVEIKDAPLLEVDTHNKVHYKHFERWRLANTLVKLYGMEQGYNYMRMICSADILAKEIQADCITAARHEKQVDAWAIRQLNKYHGFNIKVNIDQEEKDLSVLWDNIEDIPNPTLIKESPNTKTYYIKKNEYLGTIKHQLLKDCGMITLIESGAGTGKTEMVKSLVSDGKRVLLVMPFTSTIKSKIEHDDKWDYSYGNKKPSWDSKPGIALTIDKFSKLNLLELKEMDFDYVFIDESHLMFQSEYRPVMAKVIDMVRNTTVPIIMMTGTPVGETVFFDDIVHLKVIKEDVRKKEFRTFLCDRPIDGLCHMCKSMAKDISEGRRCLFPTNKGTIYKEQVEILVGYFLEHDYFIFDKPSVNYYKKSNVGDTFMDMINFKKTVDKTNILMCTTYLSVGVDILDKYDFNIYFNECWMPQEIEQFANRLRSHDLFINMYLNRKDSEGNTLNIVNYIPCNFELNTEEIMDVHAIIRACNAMIERNPVEYRYNGLVASIIRENKYIEYNEIENKYYLNETAYKVIMFERKYREYVQQLPVVAKGMIGYGYEYSSLELGEFKGSINEDFIVKDDIKNLIKQAKEQATHNNSNAVEELLDVMTEDRLHIYKDVMKGMYEIKKGNEFKEDPVSKVMIVKNVEMFEKVVPLFVSMSKMFDIEDIKDIFNHCQNTHKNFNFAAIRRIKSLTNILYNNKLDRLDIPIKDFMECSYKFADENPTCMTSELQNFISDKAIQYAEMDSNATILIKNSPLTIKKYTEALDNIFRCLVNRTRYKKKMVKLEKAELLWSEKGEKFTNFLAQIDFIDEFMDNIKVTEENIDINDIDMESFKNQEVNEPCEVK